MCNKFGVGVYEPTIYFLIKRFSDVNSQFPKRVCGLIINPLRIITTGGSDINCKQMPQILASLPENIFGASACRLPQKSQPAEFAFSFVYEFCWMQSKQIKPLEIPGANPPVSLSLRPQKLQYRVSFILFLLRFGIKTRQTN